MLPRDIHISLFKAASRIFYLSSLIPASSSTMSSNITLYTWLTPNGIKASITLEELGLPYKVEPLNVGTNVLKEEYETIHYTYEKSVPC
jgi:glutathione S-transferase